MKSLLIKSSPNNSIFIIGVSTVNFAYLVVIDGDVLLESSNIGNTEFHSSDCMIWKYENSNMDKEIKTIFLFL